MAQEKGEIELLNIPPKEGSDQQGQRPNEEEVSEPTSNSRYCTCLLLFTILSSIPMINYSLTCLNPAIPVMHQMYNESHVNRYGTPMPAEKWELLKSLTMSIVVAGALFGSFLLKAFMSCLTRRRCFLAVHYINLIGGAITSATAGLTRAYEAIIVGRFITGVAVGMALGIVPVMVGEISVAHRRPIYDGLIGVSLAIGSLLGVLFGWSKIFGTPLLWPLIPLIPVIPSLACILVRTPDTPYQILKSGKSSKLRKVLRKLRDGSESALDAEIRQMSGKSSSLTENDSDEENTSVVAHNDITLKEAIGILQYRRQFIIVLMLFASLMLNGLNHVLFYSDQIFLLAGFDPTSVTVATIIVFVFQVVATFPGTALLHRLGSWLLLIIGNVVMVVGYILLVVSLSFSGLSWMSALAIAVYFFGFAGCSNIAIFPLASEVTIEKTRPICLNFGTATLWLTGWFVGFSAAYLQKWLGAYSFLIWMGFTIGFTVYVIFFVPNTKKHSSNEIQTRFKQD